MLKANGTKTFWQQVRTLLVSEPQHSEAFDQRYAQYQLAKAYSRSQAYFDPDAEIDHPKFSLDDIQRISMA